MKVLFTRNQTAQGSESNEKRKPKATKKASGIRKQYGNPNIMGNKKKIWKPQHHGQYENNMETPTL